MNVALEEILHSKESGFLFLFKAIISGVINHDSENGGKIYIKQNIKN